MTWRRHLPPLAVLAVLAVLVTFPLALHVGTHVPGASAGDNLTFLWNQFWMREALARREVAFFFTPLLFAPLGAGLALHTHTALESLLGATVLGWLPPAASVDLVLLLYVWLAGVCAYALAFDLTRSRGAALIAALIYGASPYLVSRLLGHFNLVAVYGIPLFLLFFRRTLDGARAGPAVAAGLALALVAYDDYYYVIFCGCAAVVLLVHRTVTVSIERRGSTPALVLTRRSLAALAIAAGLAIAVIWATGGTTLEIAGTTLQLRGTFNLRGGLWVIGLLLLAARYKATVRRSPRAGGAARSLAPPLLLLAAVAGACVMPIAWRVFDLWAAGDYTTQAYRWRSAPSGIDLAMLVAGNPVSPVWASLTDRAYAAWSMSRIDAVWLGVVPTVLLAYAWRRRTTMPAAGEWWALGAVFLIWSLGPFVQLAGFNTGFVLPQALLRFVPLLNNARMPARAFVVVYLAAAMVVAVLLADPRYRPRGAALVAVGALIAIDYAGAPIALYELPRSAVYERIARDPDAGTVLELPLGLRDGFGQVGRTDPEAVYFQTIHGRPVLGGFVARLSPRVRATYMELPVISTLLALSDGVPLDADRIPSDRAAAPRVLAALDVTFVVIRRDLCPEALLEYVREVLPLRLVAEDGPRVLYVVTPGSGL